jgi:hypothetical protein
MSARKFSKPCLPVQRLQTRIPLPPYRFHPGVPRVVHREIMAIQERCVGVRVCPCLLPKEFQCSFRLHPHETILPLRRAPVLTVTVEPQSHTHFCIPAFRAGALLMTIKRPKR